MIDLSTLVRESNTHRVWITARGVQNDLLTLYLSMWVQTGFGQDQDKGSRGRSLEKVRTRGRTGLITMNTITEAVCHNYNS